MIKFIENLPADVVGVELTEEITKEEYDSTVVPKMTELAKQVGEINYLVVLKSSISQLEAGVWWDDFKMAFSHFKKWHKIAIISDQSTIRTLTDIFGFAYPGESKTFDLDQYNKAVSWVST
jgi:hypothetical protein